MTDSLPARLGRALASPIGVLISLPLLVALVGAGIYWLGREATVTASRDLARHQLAEQASDMQDEVAAALDQADPLLAGVRAVAVHDLGRDVTLLQLYDLIVARPGVAFASVSLPDGTFRGAQLVPTGAIELQESKPGELHRFVKEAGALQRVADSTTTYDPRARDWYQRAVSTGARVWTDPYPFYASHETGITCAEPVFDDAHALVAVITIDFHVVVLSSLVARPTLDDARTVVYAKDGVVLAYPDLAKRALPADDRVLRAADLHDAALDALFALPAQDRLHFLELDTRDGSYFASVAPLGGKRAGVSAPLDWFVATFVPARTLLGGAKTLTKRSLIASGGALVAAVMLALVLAWNVVRMRQQVARSRAEAASAEARARELGSYRLVAKLGTGGMGEVWRAEHRLLARAAAVKLIRPAADATAAEIAEAHQRFHHEAQAMARMKSRHTIAVYDYGSSDDGTFYYAMELLDGMDLEKLVTAHGPQPAARVIALLEQACASLAEAHDAGLLHRDIKPPNLFLCRAADEVDIVKVLDFGIVQRVYAAPEGGEVIGTPGFMAPEQLAGATLDGRVDLYALGCVAWYLLAGKEVFPRAGGEVELHRRHMHEPAPELAPLVTRWLPRELEALVQACLAKDPSARPANAREVAARLRAIEIPDEHAWKHGRAVGWWKTQLPNADEPAHVPTVQTQLLVPRR